MYSLLLDLHQWTVEFITAHVQYVLELMHAGLQHFMLTGIMKNSYYKVKATVTTMHSMTTVHE